MCFLYSKCVCVRTPLHQKVCVGVGRGPRGQNMFSRRTEPSLQHPQCSGGEFCICLPGSDRPMRSLYAAMSAFLSYQPGQRIQEERLKLWIRKCKCTAKRRSRYYFHFIYSLHSYCHMPIKQCGRDNHTFFQARTGYLSILATLF